MPNPNDLREARAELQKLQAQMADDRAFGMFSPALQRRITEAKKAIADLNVEVKKFHEQEARAARVRLVATGAAIAAYAKMRASLNSLKQAGMENTNEARRQEVAYTLLGRQVAGIFLPATRAATNATMAGANALEKLSGDGQKATFVIAGAAAGLVTFKVAQMAAVASGIKFSGVMGGIVRMLPALGLAGGVIGGLGVLFLSSNEGAKALEDTMASLVTLANALGEALDEALNNKGKFFDDFRLGLIQLGEDIGILEKGAARQFFNEVTIPNAKGRGGLDQRRAAEKLKNQRIDVTPYAQPSFGSVDSFERIQLAAAKMAIGKDVPQQQLDVAKQQLDELKKANESAIVPGRARFIVGAVD